METNTTKQELVPEPAQLQPSRQVRRALARKIVKLKNKLLNSHCSYSALSTSDRALHKTMIKLEGEENWKNIEHTMESTNAY